MDSRHPIATLAAQAADEKKAQAIVLLDLEDISMMADYFVLCNGNTPIQVRAIAQHIEEKLTAAGYKLYRSEGMQQGRWVLLDFGTVIVHVMHEHEREYYNLERLWSQGKLIPFQTEAATA